jgi:hypothetical protein
MNRLSFFIIGMPRSGTKLFRELLNNHEEVFIPEVETLFIPRLLKKYKHEKLSEEQVDEVISDIKKSLFFFYYLKDHEFNFDKLQTRNVTIKQFLDRFFEELANYRNKKASLLGDKSPNYINEISLLMDFYGEAKFIHIVRDPRDYVLSMNKAWGKNMNRAAYRWRKNVKNIHKIDSPKSQQIFEIRYEDLISNTEETLLNVCNFLGISYDNDLLKLDHSVENLGEANSAKIESNNSQKYLTQLNERQIRKIEKLTYPVLGNYYDSRSDIQSELHPNQLKKGFWKIADGLNLIKFNIMTHGVIKGIEKLLKANRTK